MKYLSKVLESHYKKNVNQLYFSLTDLLIFILEMYMYFSCLCQQHLSRNTYASMCNMALSKSHDSTIRVGVNDKNIVRERKPIILCLDMISKN